MPILLADQNVPHAACLWLAERLPGWEVMHTFHLGLALESDEVIAERAIAMGAVVLTFDEDFLDTRGALRDKLAGVIRLRVWPTRLPFVIDALERLLEEVDPEQFFGKAIVVDRQRVRVRRL